MDVPPAPTPRLLRARVVDARIIGNDVELDGVALAAGADLGEPGPSELLISVNLPGRDTQVGIALQPTRVAAAWLAWLLVTLLVMAFWLPLPRLRHRHRVTVLADLSDVTPVAPADLTETTDARGLRTH